MVIWTGNEATLISNSPSSLLEVPKKELSSWTEQNAILFSVVLSTIFPEMVLLAWANREVRKKHRNPNNRSFDFKFTFINGIKFEEFIAFYITLCDWTLKIIINEKSKKLKRIAYFKKNGFCCSIFCNSRSLLRLLFQLELF